LNEVIDPLVIEIDAPSGGTDQGRVERQPPAGANWFHSLGGTLDARQDQLARRTTLSRGHFVETAVNIARKIDGGANGGTLHVFIVAR
jgi:hypothetical protein